MNEGITVNRNRLFLLPRYYKNFWKLKDKWPPGEAWVVDLVSDKASDGSVVNWICSCIPQRLTGQRGSDRKRKSECTHACEHKDNNVPRSFHSPLEFFSWCVLRDVLLQIQRVSFVFYLTAAVQNLLPGSQLARCHPQTAATQWAGYSHHITSLCPQLHLENTTLLSTLHLTFYSLHILNLNAYNISIRSDSTNDKNLLKCYHYLLLHYY